MIGHKWKLLLVGVVMAVSLLALTADANAFWGCHRGFCGGWYGYGGYSPYYVGGCGYCGYGGYGWGYGGYGWGYGGCGYYGGYSYPAYSYVSYSSPCCTGGVVVASSATVKAPAAATVSVKKAESGLLTIYVPTEAKVVVNGRETKSTGSKRQYVSYDLRPGFSYSYTIQASINREGKTIEDTRTVTLTAGGHQSLSFEFNPSSVEGLVANP